MIVSNASRRIKSGAMTRLSHAHNLGRSPLAPGAVVKPAPFNPCAIARRDSAPFAFRSSITGSKSSRRLASSRWRTAALIRVPFAAIPAIRSILPRCPPNATPRVLAACTPIWFVPKSSRPHVPRLPPRCERSGDWPLGHCQFPQNRELIPPV